MLLLLRQMELDKFQEMMFISPAVVEAHHILAVHLLGLVAEASGIIATQGRHWQGYD